MEYWILWILVIFILTFIEVITINLITIWFVMSAIIALIASLFISNFTIQFMIFGIIGIILLITTRPLLKSIFDKETTKTNADRVVGMNGIATEEIKKAKVGEIKVDGKLWSAVSDKTIKVGEEVLVESIDGVKLVVTKIKQYKPKSPSVKKPSSSKGKKTISKKKEGNK